MTASQRSQPARPSRISSTPSRTMPPGVTRFDVVCQPTVVPTVIELTQQWADDRVLSDVTRGRLAGLVRAAMTHGLRFDPRAVSVRIGWLEVDRIRLDLRWLDCTASARPTAGSSDVAATLATLDSLSDDWGLGRAGDGWVIWMVVDSD